MGSSQPLATESFSFSWLTNEAPSFDYLHEPLRPSLDDGFNEPTPQEIPYYTVKSEKFSEEEAHNFNFDIPISESSGPTLVHADEIFSDGHIMPIYVNRSKIEAFNASSSSIPAVPISSVSSRSVVRILRKWRNSSNGFFLKCFGFLRPVYRSVGCSRQSIRVDDIDRKVWEVQSLSNSLQASPKRRTACSADDMFDNKQMRNKIDGYRRLRKVKSSGNSPQESRLLSPSYSTDVLCDIESSIYEAILHCKRSNDK